LPKQACLLFIKTLTDSIIWLMFWKWDCYALQLEIV